jgi:hypothetical protein
LKIYTDDPNLPYKYTKLKALHTKGDIDAVFARWGVKDVYWRWDPDHNEVFVQFKIVEVIDDLPVNVTARVEAPMVWERRTRREAERINWDISLRVMFWYIKSQLESAYLLQSSKIAAFLPYIASNDGRVLKDVVIPRLNEVQQLVSLPKKVIDVGEATPQ